MTETHDIEFPHDAGAQLVWETLRDRGVITTPEELGAKLEGYEGDLWMDFFGPLMDRIEEVLGFNTTNRFDPSTLVDSGMYEKRCDIGQQAIDLGDGEDPETDASDVISDILTHLYGPAGWWRESKLEADGVIREEAMEMRDAGDARWLLDKALSSWVGDAEDYQIREES